MDLALNNQQWFIGHKTKSSLMTDKKTDIKKNKMNRKDF